MSPSRQIPGAEQGGKDTLVSGQGTAEDDEKAPEPSVDDILFCCAGGLRILFPFLSPLHTAHTPEFRVAFPLAVSPVGHGD